MNKLHIQELDDGRVRTDIEAFDGVKIMEIHRKGLDEYDVLKKIREKQHYKDYPGEWEIVILEDGTKFSGKMDVSFSNAMSYIYQKKHPDVIYLC